MVEANPTDSQFSELPQNSNDDDLDQYGDEDYDGEDVDPED